MFLRPSIQISFVLSEEEKGQLLLTIEEEAASIKHTITSIEACEKSKEGPVRKKPGKTVSYCHY